MQSPDGKITGNVIHATLRLTFAGATATCNNLDSELYGFFGELTNVSQYQDLLDGLIDVVQIQGPFDGIMGFSEGGIIAATLLVEDARRPFANFKCAIFVSAATPLDPDRLRAGIVKCLDPARDGVSIHVPTAHIYSRENGTSSIIGHAPSPLDKLWSEAGWRIPEEVHNSLVRICDNSQVFVHDHGHQVPGSRHRPALRGALRAINRTVESADD